MSAIDNALTKLCQSISERERRPTVPFKIFLELAATKPDLFFRDIFHVFHDMIHTYVGEGYDEYPDDPESINYVYYDCSKLLADGVDHPFFADRLFANRLVNLVASFRRGIHQNRIYIFEGPHGCGKSTFLNNLLMKFEHFTTTDEGSSYEVVWRLDRQELAGYSDKYEKGTQGQNENPNGLPSASQEGMGALPSKDYIEIPCPSHDNPLLLIPKSYRKDLLNELLPAGKFKDRLFSATQYEWVFRRNPCTICLSLYQALLDILGSPDKIFSMLFARRYQFQRRLGEGITVFNPGDRLTKASVVTNPLLQRQLDSLLKDSNRVRYLYSRLAKTNNGVYALMDIKAHNRERFANLHGIISEGVHKVGDIEENVNSLFLALMNPEDHEGAADMQSFSDRITYIKIPYVLDYNTEVKIYKSVFGRQIDSSFLPRVLENFAKVIISSRLKTRSDGLLEWIGDPEKYRQYCDRNLQLLKMDIYSGIIPVWLTEEDRKTFTANRRRAIIDESETEGDKGFSGRESIKIFGAFFTTYLKADGLVTMEMVCKFFKAHRGEFGKMIPDGFLDSLLSFYNYQALQEVKEALYYYNEERISRDIQNYLFAVNFEIGTIEKCVYTGEELEISEDFLENIEGKLLGSNTDRKSRLGFRNDVQKRYTSSTLTQEVIVDGKSISQTQIYHALYERYVHNLKEKVMDPFLKNDNFRNAIKDYKTDVFKTYDKRIREDVGLLIRNLKKKFGYTEGGAKEICVYVIDNDLARQFSGKQSQPFG